MLGLRPRLRAQNSLWDLVSKHPADLYPTSQLQLQLHRQQPVEEGLDGLPPLPISPTSPSHPVATLKHDEETSAEQHISPDMAPVRSSVFIVVASSDFANYNHCHYRRKTRSGHAKKPAKSSMVRLKSQSPLPQFSVQASDMNFRFYLLGLRVRHRHPP